MQRLDSFKYATIINELWKKLDNCERVNTDTLRKMKELKEKIADPIMQEYLNDKSSTTRTTKLYNGKMLRADDTVGNVVVVDEYDPVYTTVIEYLRSFDAWSYPCIAVDEEGNVLLMTTESYYDNTYYYISKDGEMIEGTVYGGYGSYGSYYQHEIFDKHIVLYSADEEYTGYDYYETYVCRKFFKVKDFACGYMTAGQAWSEGTVSYRANPNSYANKFRYLGDFKYCISGTIMHRCVDGFHDLRILSYDYDYDNHDHDYSCFLTGWDSILYFDITAGIKTNPDGSNKTEEELANLSPCGIAGNKFGHLFIVRDLETTSIVIKGDYKDHIDPLKELNIGETTWIISEDGASITNHRIRFDDIGQKCDPSGRMDWTYCYGTICDTVWSRHTDYMSSYTEIISEVEGEKVLFKIWNNGKCKKVNASEDDIHRIINAKWECGGTLFAACMKGKNDDWSYYRSNDFGATWTQMKDEKGNIMNPKVAPFLLHETNHKLRTPISFAGYLKDGYTFKHKELKRYNADDNIVACIKRVEEHYDSIDGLTDLPNLMLIKNIPTQEYQKTNYFDRMLSVQTDISEEAREHLIDNTNGDRNNYCLTFKCGKHRYVNFIGMSPTWDNPYSSYVPSVWTRESSRGRTFVQLDCYKASYSNDFACDIAIVGDSNGGIKAFRVCEAKCSGTPYNGEENYYPGIKPGKIRYEDPESWGSAVLDPYCYCSDVDSMGWIKGVYTYQDVNGYDYDDNGVCTIGKGKQIFDENM